MSISMCAVRLEIAEGHETIAFEEYISRSTQMASRSTSGNAPAERLAALRRHDRRVMSDISVETYTPQADTPDDKNDAAACPTDGKCGAGGEVVVGPSGRAVSRVELVRSGRELPSTNTATSAAADTKETVVTSAAAAASNTASGIEVKPFTAGNPFVESTKGLLHFYKENTMTSLDECTQRSRLICMLAVPAKLAVHDLLRFTAACYPDIERMRVVRDNTPNQYMVLIRFKSQEAADSFYANFNGVQYNSMEPELCCLVYVSRVDVVDEADTARSSVSGFTELPTCPVCLERMDESVDGILTVLCNHSFHSGCLRQWSDASCPVCRYVQTPQPTADQHSNTCFECRAIDSLWICLICGHVGCGRYLGGHAYTHFLDSGHTYSMQVGSSRVWDYVGDNFVHRLVQNNDDGKMVEVHASTANFKQEDAEEKLEGVQLEYTYLLTSQLQSQREYYEQLLARQQLLAQSTADQLRDSCSEAVQRSDKLQQQLGSSCREKATSEKKLQSLTQRLAKYQHELAEERAMNSQLRDNQQLWQQRVQQLQQQFTELQLKNNQEVGELKEQVRDLMFYLEAQQKVAASSVHVQQELAAGSIVVPEAAAGGATGGGTGNRSGNRRKRR